MIWRFLTSLVMRLVEPLVIYWKGRSDARREAERRALRDEKQRLEKGRQRVSDGRDLPPDERVRRNDEFWQ
jgi:hypothetical protein